MENALIPSPMGFYMCVAMKERKKNNRDETNNICRIYEK